MFNWRNIFKEKRTTAVAIIGIIGMVLVLVAKDNVTPEEGEVVKEGLINIWDGLAGLIVAAEAIVLSLAKDK